MTEPEDPKRPASPQTDEPASASADHTPGEELRAAFGHLKSAADLFLGRLRHDESLKKVAEDVETAVERAAVGVERAAASAAVEAEKAVRTLGERAQPIAKDIGSELGRIAKTMRTALDPEPIPGEGSEPSASPEATDANEADAKEEEKAEAKEAGSDRGPGGNQPT